MAHVDTIFTIFTIENHLTHEGSTAIPHIWGAVKAQKSKGSSI